MIIKRLLISVFSILLLTLILNNCYYDSEEYLYPELNCDTTNVTFSVSVKGVLSANCYTCHSNANAVQSGGGIKLENYDDVKNNTRLMGAIRHQQGYLPMPDGGGSLSACDLNIIQAWYNNSKPKN